MEHYAGVDLHKRVTQLALLREGRSPAHFRFRNEKAAVTKVLHRLPPGTKIAVESTGTWWWFVEQARQCGHDVYLSHPQRTKAIASARLKSDKVDAEMLGKLLQGDLLPTVWIPGERERYVRELLTHRQRLTRTRTAVINELHAVYSKRNIELQGAVWSKAQPTAVRVRALTGYGPQIVQENVAQLRLLNRQLAEIDKKLQHLVLQDPQAKRLLSISGVGTQTALAVSCWVGDIARFPNAKKLASYFGLAPRVRNSAGKHQHGHITKQGNPLVRWLLTQAALSHIRHAKGDIRRQYLGALHRRGKSIARVAAARKLVGVMFHLLQDEIEYAEFVRRGNSTQ
ncbi:MAG: IS110 family transposase [Terriglobia bacterium]